MQQRAFGWTGRARICSVALVAAVSVMCALGFTVPGAAADPLPMLPDGVNVAIGAAATANSSAAPSTSLSNIDDGDGTTRWCPSGLGIHRVTLDLGRTVDISGTGVTFSGQEGNDGSFYTISAGLRPDRMRPLPNQASGGNPIVQGPLYLFAGTAADPGATVRARYLTLTYQVPREQNICVQELRVFSTDARNLSGFQLGDDLTNLAGDPDNYTANGASAPLLSILKSGGTNYARLRLLVDPSDCGTTCPDLANELAMASQLRQAGMKILLDIEYSDSPTSPTAQATPAAWAGQPLGRLAHTVRTYTRSVIHAFAANGTPVSEVSIGNEITQGMLWPVGQLTSASASLNGAASGRPGAPQQQGWSALTTLLRAGLAGAEAGNPAGNPLRTQIDIDAGADATTSADFVSHLIAAGVRFDVIGESYTPWEQGPMSALRANLTALTERFGKPVMIAAGQFPYADITGYGSYSDTVPYPDTLPGYLITPAGQASYERDLVSLVASLPHGLGQGVVYLSPDTEGSLGEFTPAGAAEPAVDAYRIGSGAKSGGTDVQPIASVPPGTPPAEPIQPAESGNAALPGTLPPLPPGLNRAIGARVWANAGSAPGEPLSNVDDGDGTTRWCPSTEGVHQVTIDLGHVENLTGTGITFSGEQPGDGAAYSVSTGITRPAQTPFPNQATGDRNPITQGPLYLFAGTASSLDATVRARYVTLTYDVPREQTICVQEFRAFAPAPAADASRLQLGNDLSTLLADPDTYTLDGQSMPLLSILRSGGENYVRLRLWVDPTSGNFGTPSAPPGCSASTCPDLANDLAMAKQVTAAGMKVLLDIHYSDTWADPGHQNVPAAWEGETLPQLARSVRTYTRSAIRAFAAQGTPVSEVAVGNEITQGMLWQYTTLDVPDGTVTPAGTTTITVTSAAGIQPGDTLYIDSLSTGNSIAGVADPSTDIATVASIGTPGSSGTPITLTAPLAHSHVGPVTVQDVQDSGHLLFDNATDTADWTSLTTLLKAAISGARAGNPAGNHLLVQLHLDRGGDDAAATDFIEHVLAAGVKFNVIGLSYYPWYHGPMSAMKANLVALIDRFHKYVEIAEDQFPYNPIGGYGYGQYTPDSTNYPATMPGYLVTPDGQASYQRDLVSMMAALPEHRGLGVFYWNGDSTSWQGMFDWPGIAQPVVDAYQISTTPTSAP